MLHQSVDGALGRCIRWKRANDCAGRERREENDAASLRHDRQRLLHKKKRTVLTFPDSLLRRADEVIE